MANNRLYIKAPDGALLYLAKSLHGPSPAWTLECSAESFHQWTAEHPGGGTKDGEPTAYCLVDESDDVPTDAEIDARVEEVVAEWRKETPGASDDAAFVATHASWLCFALDFAASGDASRDAIVAVARRAQTVLSELENSLLHSDIAGNLLGVLMDSGTANTRPTSVVPISRWSSFLSAKTETDLDAVFDEIFDLISAAYLTGDTADCDQLLAWISDPKNVKQLHEDVFLPCLRLTHAWLPGSLRNWNSALSTVKAELTSRGANVGALLCGLEDP